MSLAQSRDCAGGKPTNQRVRIPVRARIFLHVVPTGQPTFQRVPGTFYLGIKPSGLEADDSVPKPRKRGSMA
jgi:hypothetical protein